MFNEYKFNKEIIEYWKHFGLTEKDFHCRECGKLMLDFSTINNLQFKPKNGEITSKSVVKYKTTQPYVESEHNRWLVTGRTLSGKTFFRHLCWECFFKHLSEIEDIPKRARKSSWYKDILAGNFRPPAKCASPSKYFKLIFDIADEELEKEHKKFDTASLDSFIRRHGEIEGPKKYEEYKKRQAYTCSKEYMMNEKGMTEQQWNEFNANRACTKKNFIKRYGKELGEKKWKDYCELESYVGCKLDYFIEKFGEEEGKKVYLSLNKKKAQTLENFIRLYGEIEGKKRYETLCHKQYSNISKTIFDIIQQRLGDYAIGSRYGENECSINLYFEDGTCRVCYPDYLLHTKIIEFNGDYWHANPKFYKENERMKFIIPQKTKYSGDLAKNIWEYDKKKKTTLEKMGYKVKGVWESDYHKNPEKILDECVDFLKS
jgi:hypothetical protein